MQQSEKDSFMSGSGAASVGQAPVYPEEALHLNDGDVVSDDEDPYAAGQATKPINMPLEKPRKPMA